MRGGAEKRLVHSDRLPVNLANVLDFRMPPPLRGTLRLTERRLLCAVPNHCAQSLVLLPTAGRRAGSIVDEIQISYTAGFYKAPLAPRGSSKNQMNCRRGTGHRYPYLLVGEEG